MGLGLTLAIPIWSKLGKQGPENDDDADPAMFQKARDVVKAELR